MGFMAFPGGTVEDTDSIYEYLVQYNLVHDVHAPAPFITSAGFGFTLNELYANYGSSTPLEFQYQSADYRLSDWDFGDNDGDVYRAVLPLFDNFSGTTLSTTYVIIAVVAGVVVLLIIGAVSYFSYKTTNTNNGYLPVSLTDDTTSTRHKSPSPTMTVTYMYEPEMKEGVMSDVEVSTIPEAKGHQQRSRFAKIEEI